MKQQTTTTPMNQYLLFIVVLTLFLLLVSLCHYFFPRKVVVEDRKPAAIQEMNEEETVGYQQELEQPVEREEFSSMSPRLRPMHHSDEEAYENIPNFGSTKKRPSLSNADDVLYAREKPGRMDTDRLKNLTFIEQLERRFKTKTK